MANIIKTDGTTIAVTPKNRTDFSLAELRAIVGGHIEVVYMAEWVMVLNEEGKILDLPVNILATYIAHMEKVIAPSDVIVGDVLICSENQII